MQQITIVGLGLIGASIGLGLRRWAAESGSRAGSFRLVGFDLELLHQNEAKRIKAVDRTTWTLAEAVREADLIVVATPPGSVPEVFETIAEHAPDGAVVTDTCSTKAAVMRWANEYLPPRLHFVGGHPMAGKTQSIEGADADLFRGAVWVVTPSLTASQQAVETVLGLVRALGAEPRFLDPEEHDSYVAAISHVPFLLSVALMRVTSGDVAWREMRLLAAGGFRDTTRLALGSPRMYRDICATNASAIVRWLDTAIDELRCLRELIAEGSEESLAELQQRFERARDARAEWATQERRTGERLQTTSDELPEVSVGQHLQQLFLGGLVGRRRPEKGRSRPKSENQS
ncbi:MAG: prephenate dehydrogenase/arogenate dehydrogenase family protein [Thermomicrobium sp.]|nr:prephenate dehydrogenase/arogenate dehydrogenase family protein [Thermomicrobium sp.]MDW7982007.1 prephenate dehydrogenase/arogenate dehydrogenase family protein [Thermomicrobium sp.]